LCPYKNQSVELIRRLYGCDRSSIGSNTCYISLTNISRLTGAPWKFIKQAVTNP